MRLPHEHYLTVHISSYQFLSAGVVQLLSRENNDGVYTANAPAAAEYHNVNSEACKIINSKSHHDLRAGL